MKQIIKLNTNCFVLISIILSSIIMCYSCSPLNKIEVVNHADIAEVDLFSMYPSPKLVIATHSEWTKTHYPERIAEFMESPLEKNDIVFLGNSITEQGGDWGNRLKNQKTKNRGIAGDTSDGVLARLGEIIYFEPSKIYIMIGINDLFREDMSSQKVYDNIIRIVRSISKESPATEIYVQTILPTTTENIKDKIGLTNTLLQSTEATEIYNLIPLHYYFALENGSMNMEYSTDGVHLNEKGYNLWVNEINP